MTTSKWHQIEADNGSDAIGDVVLDQRSQAKFKCRHKRWPFLPWVLPKRYGCARPGCARDVRGRDVRGCQPAREQRGGDEGLLPRCASTPTQVSCGPAIWAGQP